MVPEVYIDDRNRDAPLKHWVPDWGFMEVTATLLSSSQ